MTPAKEPHARIAPVGIFAGAVEHPVTCGPDHDHRTRSAQVGQQPLQRWCQPA